MKRKKLKCIIFGCKYKQTQAKVKNGIFTIKGKCIHCGTEKELVKQPWEEAQKFLNIP